MPACFGNTCRHVLENMLAYTGNTCWHVSPIHAGMYFRRAAHPPQGRNPQAGRKQSTSPSIPHAVAKSLPHLHRCANRGLFLTECKKYASGFFTESHWQRNAAFCYLFILLLQMRITLYLRKLSIYYPVFALNYAIFTQNHNEGAKQVLAMTFTKPLRRPRCPGSACDRSCSGCQSHSSRWGRELRTGGFLLSPDKGSRHGLGCC
jgi:hypothetical protein